MYLYIFTFASLQDMDLTSSLVTSTHRKVQRIHTALNEVRNSTAILEANLGRTVYCNTTHTCIYVYNPFYFFLHLNPHLKLKY